MKNRRKLFVCKYCGLTVNYLKGHIRTFHRKQYVMKKDDGQFFAGAGKCDFCLKPKQVHLIEYAGRWKEICDLCEQNKSPYLRESKKSPVEKVGNIRI